jgi:hypothetical protein
MLVISCAAVKDRLLFISGIYNLSFAASMTVITSNVMTTVVTKHVNSMFITNNAS